jgi:hypothetical protein
VVSVIHTQQESTMRDMTKAAYEKKIAQYGFGPRQPFGHRSLPAPHDHVAVCEWNGGDTYRGRLAYLLNQLQRIEAKAGK